MEKQELLAEIDARRAHIIDIFIQHPQFSEYFYDKDCTKSAKALKNHDELAKLYALCELLLTHFSMIVRVGSYMNYAPEEVWLPHKESISRFIQRSETLRQYYQKHHTCFHPALKSFFD